MTELGIRFSVYDNDVLASLCNSVTLQHLCLSWSRRLTKSQLRSIRCRLMNANQRPTQGELMESYELLKLVSAAEGQWLETVLESKRLVTYFQPIVNTESPTEVYAYECLLRARETSGELITPDRLFSAARATGKVAQLDHESRMTAIATAQDKQLGTCIFINFNPRFLERTASLMRKTLQSVIESGIPTERFVFEVVESDEIEDVGRLMGIVEECRAAGCRVALDDIGNGYNSLNAMAAVRPDFIKLDRDLIDGVESDLYKSRVAGKLIELAKELKIKTVAEGIETAMAWQWAADQGADYCQGFLFGVPAEIPQVPQFSVAPSNGTPSNGECRQNQDTPVVSANVVAGLND